MFGLDGAVGVVAAQAAGEALILGPVSAESRVCALHSQAWGSAHVRRHQAPFSGVHGINALQQPQARMLPLTHALTPYLCIRYRPTTVALRSAIALQARSRRWKACWMVNTMGKVLRACMGRGVVEYTLPAAQSVLPVTWLLHAQCMWPAFARHMACAMIAGAGACLRVPALPARAQGTHLLQ